MNIPDLVNGLFEFGAGVLQWRNALQIYRDKEVKGVYWPVWIFFTLWGYWNLFYYPVLGQWWSFFGGISIVAGNTAWTTMAWYYMRRKK